jgi:hypothetical protein
VSARPPELAAILCALADAQELQARALRALAEALDAGAVAAPTAPRYASARSNPIGSERGFKAACASGAFPVFKQGRAVAARWSDVEAYMEARARPVRAAPPVEVDEDRQSLARMGVRLAPANDMPHGRAARRTR